MPLKLYPPRAGKTPYWSVRGTYLNVHVDRSAKTGKRALAAKVLTKIERDIESGSFALKGEVTFATAAVSYMNAGGDRRFLKRLLKHFGDRPLSQLDQRSVDDAAENLYPGGSPATRNRQVYTPVSAVLRHAKHGFELSRPKGAGGKKQTAWLWPEQAEAIFGAAAELDEEFASLLIVLCYTGMRLSEALNLTWDNVRLQDGYAFIPTTKTDEPRAAYLPPVAVAALANLQSDVHGARVFRFAKSGHLYSLLKAAFFRAEVEVPQRSAFHIFRHTYASWMRRYGGADTKSLIATGAWKDRKSVDRYEHVVVSEESKRAALLPTPKARKA